MPFAYKGFGTAYCGQCDFRPDGSFVTTEWITLAYVPVIPFRSSRLVRAPAQDLNLVVYRSVAYVILEKVSICWPQVLRVYLFVIGAVAWCALLIWLWFFKFSVMSGSNVPLLMVLMLFFICLIGMPPIAVACFFRKRKAGREVRDYLHKTRA